MPDEIHCQSCGMPLNDDHREYIAKEADGSDSVYCTYCYRDGQFTQPGATVDDMIAVAMPHVAAKIGEDAARQYLAEFIPTLARWKNFGENAR